MILNTSENVCIMCEHQFFFKCRVNLCREVKKKHHFHKEMLNVEQAPYFCKLVNF